MNKKEVIKMAEEYSSRTIPQVDYMAGFQAACNIVRQKLEPAITKIFAMRWKNLRRSHIWIYFSTINVKQFRKELIWKEIYMQYAN